MQIFGNLDIEIFINKFFRIHNFIEGGADWWSADGKEPPDAGENFGEPPYETEDYGYEIGPNGEGRFAGNDGAAVSGDVDEEPIRHSRN